MRRPLHHAGRDGRRHRDDPGNRRLPGVHPARRAHHRGSCHRRRDGHPELRVAHPDRGVDHQDARHRPSRGGCRGAGACRQATYRAATYRGAERPAGAGGDAESAAPPAAPTRTGCCRRVVYAARAWARRAADRVHPSVPGRVAAAPAPACQWPPAAGPRGLALQAVPAAPGLRRVQTPPRWEPPWPEGV